MSGNTEGVVALNIVTALIDDLAQKDPGLKQRLANVLTASLQNAPEDMKRESNLGLLFLGFKHCTSLSPNNLKS